jgi:hypothetical protein
LDVSAAGRATIDYLREYGCAADIVIAGTPRAGRSDFTAEGTFIFTEYQVDVEAVIRGQTVFSPSQVLVLWPGGALVHKGRPVTVSDASYRPLATGRKYLLFLRQIDQGGFETITETAGSDETGAQAYGLGVGTLRERLKSDVLVAIAQAAVSGCNR